MRDSDAPQPTAAWSAEDWARFLEDRFGFSVRVQFGRSRTAPVQARALRGASGDRTGWELRLHRRFAHAPEDVRDALAKWLRVGRRARRAGPILDDWIDREIASLPAAPRRISLAPVGRAHDLTVLASEAFAGEFAHDFEPEHTRTRPHITWGRRTRSRSRRSLRLGSFEPTSRVVRIHPVLDQEGVPDWFVRFVLKHEILHAVINAYRDGAGRWVHHGEAFRAREASWPEYQPALAWETRNLARLIRSAREGTDLRVRAEDVAPISDGTAARTARSGAPRRIHAGPTQAGPAQIGPTQIGPTQKGPAEAAKPAPKARGQLDLF